MITLDLYSQLDPAWKNVPLGTMGRTLGSDGCAMTSLSMALSGFGIKQTPIEVLAALKGVGGVQNSGDLIWSLVHQAYPAVYFNFRWSTTLEERNLAFRKDPQVAVDDICLLLALGQPVLMRVQAPTYTHFVVAKEILTDDLLVNDPNGGVEIPYSTRYGKLTDTLLAYVVLIGQPQGRAANVSPALKERIIQNTAISLQKAAAIEAGENVETYAKEILDTLD